MRLTKPIFCCLMAVSTISGRGLAQAHESRPFARLAYPIELSVGAELPVRPWTYSEVRAGLGFRPDLLGFPLSASAYLAQRFTIPGFPLDLGAYAGLELCDPDAGLVALPRYGVELEARFKVADQGFRASISYGLGKARYTERYDGPSFSSMREAIVYEPTLSLALSWIPRFPRGPDEACRVSR